MRQSCLAAGKTRVGVVERNLRALSHLTTLILGVFPRGHSVFPSSYFTTFSTFVKTKGYVFNFQMLQKTAVLTSRHVRDPEAVKTWLHLQTRGRNGDAGGSEPGHLNGR